MDSKVRANERHFVCIKLCLLREGETMLKVCADSKSAVAGIRSSYTTSGKIPNNFNASH